MGEPISLTAKSSFGLKIAEGAYAHKARIKSVLDFSNYPGRQEEPNKYKSGYEPEICIKLFLELEGLEWEKELKVMGWFQRDKNQRIIDWSWSDAKYLLTEFVDEPKIDNEDFHAYEFTLKELIGQEIIYISYITPGTWTNKEGVEKPSYADWGHVFHPHATEEELKMAFSKSMDYLMNEKRGGFRYAPEEAVKWEKAGKFGYSLDSEEYQKANEEIKKMAPKDEDMPF